MTATDAALAYIRGYYGVPAYVGSTVIFEPRPGEKLLGTIIGGEDAHLLVRFGAAADPTILHPTWNVSYLPAEANHGR